MYASIKRISIQGIQSKKEIESACSKNIIWPDSLRSQFSLVKLPELHILPNSRELLKLMGDQTKKVVGLVAYLRGDALGIFEIMSDKEQRHNQSLKEKMELQPSAP